MPPKVTKTLTIASRVEQAHDAQQRIMADIQSAGFSAEAGFAIRLALDEALSNAVKHGNQSDPSKKITIEYGFNSDCATIRITDEGEGFSPQQVPDPTLDENLERPHGRGLMLMRAYMTDVHYNDRGNTVTLIKNRDCPLPLRR